MHHVSDEDAREECYDTAQQGREDGKRLCSAQRAQRLEICGEIGEARFDRDFDLQPGVIYTLDIKLIAENGNQTVCDVRFTTAD